MANSDTAFGLHNKQTKIYIGIRVHDEECDCENEEECWYYVKYLDEL